RSGAAWLRSASASTIDSDRSIMTGRPHDTRHAWDASLPEHLERVGPLVLAKARDAPQLGEWFDGARRGRGSEIEPFPAELVDDLRNGRLRVGIVAAIEHRRLPRLEVRIDHAGGTDAVERLHEADGWKRFLQLLEQRGVRPGEVLDDAVDRRRLGDRVGRVDHDLATQVRLARGA